MRRFALAIALMGAVAPGHAWAQPAPPAMAADQQSAVAAANAPASAALEPLPAVEARILPRNLTPWRMFLQADRVVQLVMIGLAFASVVTWTVLFAKGAEILSARLGLRRALAIAEAETTLAGLQHHLSVRTGAAGTMVALAAAEIRLSEGAPGTLERVASRLHRREVAFGRKLARGTGVLATIGATAPFVGLFGTVWGIMNSFVGISQAQTTNLAVVAPGIAEALLATATGLVAAIPAVVIYNVFAREIGGCRALHADLAAAVQRLVSRDLDVRREARGELVD